MGALAGSCGTCARAGCRCRPWWCAPRSAGGRSSGMSILRRGPLRGPRRPTGGSPRPTRGTRRSWTLRASCASRASPTASRAAAACLSCACRGRGTTRWAWARSGGSPGPSARWCRALRAAGGRCPEGRAASCAGALHRGPAAAGVAVRGGLARRGRCAPRGGVAGSSHPAARRGAGGQGEPARLRGAHRRSRVPFARGRGTGYRVRPPSPGAADVAGPLAGPELGRRVR